MHYTDLSSFGCDQEHGGLTSNLEFRFSGPGSIPNSVQQYNVLRGAELAELRRRRERTHGFPLFCKVRCPGSDVNSMVKCRDLDVVTQLSLDSGTRIPNEEDADEEGSDDQGGLSVRLRGGGADSSPARGKGKSPRTRKVKCAPAKSPRKQQQPRRRPKENCDVLDKLKNLHLEVCAELQTLVKGEQPSESPSPSTSPRKAKKVAPKPRRMPSKGLEWKPPLELPPRSGDQVSYEDYYQPQPKYVDIMPSAMMSQGIEVNVCTCPAATPQSAIKFMEQYGSMEPESLTPFFHEDSDLDHEFVDRKGYLRYVEPRPQVDDESSEEDRVANTDTDHHAVVAPFQPLAGKPCFIELEKRPHKVSLLRSLSPMRYTSQGSELLLANQKPAPAAPAPSRLMQEIEVPPLDLQARKKPRNNAPKSRNTVNKATKSVKSSQVAEKAVRPGRVPVESKVRLPSRSQSGAASLNPGKNPSSATNPAPTPQPPQAQVTPAKRNPKRMPRKPSPTVAYSKSLEDLKAEKLRIYNKISFTQERVIAALDKLQINLLQLPPAPHGSGTERQKRQRNAFEFCVRFARNFLYPLKGMIDDVRLTSVATFNSAVSNEACHRVMCVYGLMLQSIQTYQRQLRYFLLEKVAQKLSALIEMIYTMTNCCLDKNILDRHDPVVECLQERCTRFLSFIEDMQEERFKLARESLRRRHKHPMHQAHQAHPASRSRSRNRSGIHHSPRLGPAPVMPLPRMIRLPKQEKLRSHDHYDLKMCLNDLKVYEPRVVPKEPKATSHRRRGRRHHKRRHSMTPLQMVAGSPVVDMPSDAELQAAKSEVRTQMQIQAEDGADGGSISNSSLSLPTATAGDGGSPREAMLEAVRRVTRSQLQQVLDPMMRSLSAMLNEKIARMGGK